MTPEQEWILRAVKVLQECAEWLEMARGFTSTDYEMAEKAKTLAAEGARFLPDQGSDGTP